MPDGSSYTRTLIYPRDLLGRRVGLFDDRPSLNWYGFDEFWVYIAGEKLILGQGDTTLPHENAISSTTMVTNQEGTPSGDIIYGPWGNTITGGGSYADVFAGLGFQINYPLPPSATRDYNPALGRWLMPDPAASSAESRCQETLRIWVVANGVAGRYAGRRVTPAPRAAIPFNGLGADA